MLIMISELLGQRAYWNFSQYFTEHLYQYYYEESNNLSNSRVVSYISTSNSVLNLKKNIK